MVDGAPRHASEHKRGLLYPIAALAVILLAAGLRIYHLDYESLGFDELSQVAKYRGSFFGVVEGATHHAQPPLDYLIGWGLDQIGLAGSDWWVRAPACCFGIGSIVALMWWVRRLFGGPAALATGALVAVCPLHLRMSQEARPYTIFLFLMLLSLILYARARARNDWASWFVFGIVFFLTLLSRWVGPLVLMMNLGIYACVLLALALIRGPRADRRRALARFTAGAGAMLLPFAVYFPLFAWVLRENTEYVQTGERGPAQLLARFTGMLYTSLRTAFPVRAGIPVFPWVTLALVALAVCVALASLLRRGGALAQAPEGVSFHTETRSTHLGVFLFAFGTFGLTYAAVFSLLGSDRAKPQYLLPLAVFAAACMGYAAQTLWRLTSRWRGARILPAAIVVAIAIPMGKVCIGTLVEETNQDWRAACQIAVRHGDARDGLFVGAALTSESRVASFRGVERYTGRKGPVYSMRSLAQMIPREALRVGTVYVALYRRFYDYRAVPPGQAELPEGAEAYDLVGLALYRFPGQPETGADRLLRILSAIAARRPPGGGHMDLYHAISRLQASLDRPVLARKSYADAVAECRGPEERRLFVGGSADTRQWLGIDDEQVIGP